MRDKHDDQTHANDPILQGRRQFPAAGLKSRPEQIRKAVEGSPMRVECVERRYHHRVDVHARIGEVIGAN